MKKNSTMDVINRYAGNYRPLFLIGGLPAALSTVLMLVFDLLIGLVCLILSLFSFVFLMAMMVGNMQK